MDKSEHKGDEALYRDIEQRIDKMIDFVQSSDQKAKDGFMPDLRDLDNKVSGICEDVKLLDKEQAVKISVKLQEVISAIEHFAVTLHENNSADSSSDVES